MRYFFHVFRSGEWIRDDEGSELATDEAAQNEAFQSALELEREFPTVRSRVLEDVLEVVDAEGRRLMALRIRSPFEALVSAA